MKIGIGPMKLHKILFAAFFGIGFFMQGCGTLTESGSQRATENSTQSAHESTAPKAPENAYQGTRERASQSETESFSQSTSERASQKESENSSQHALEELERALALSRQDLRISEATEERIASELKQLKKSGTASPEVIAAHEAYLDRVQDMVLENRKVVGKLEALYTKYVPTGKSPSPASSINGEYVPSQKVPDEKEFDELGALDRELDDSLASFDEMLLRELELIRTESAEKMRDLAEQAAAAAQGLPEDGETGQEGAESEEREMTTEAGEGDSQTETAGTPQQGSKGKGEGRARDQEESSRPSGHDDDIVARQIREAAEKETDPVLKEKLWKEYENYKKGNRQ
ncbi:MAG: hypothetical protein AMK69_24220 [Nitrospira bacterium SG8_3]|nr:MAG: hypothetical protein AMK69_24220 [Nitrospira bacterium SG8_3]